MTGRGASLRSQVNKRVQRLLVEARAAAGLSQQALASKLGRPQSFVSKYERGERRLDVGELVELAATLGLDAAEFVAALVKTSSQERMP